MRRVVLVLVVALPALSGCLTRTAPSDDERKWEQRLRATLSPGWKVVAITGEPKKNRFVCWLEAPGPRGRTYRVEVRVTPRPNAPDEREWSVSVHPPADPHPGNSVSFTARWDGAGPVEVAGESGGDPAAVEEARPLAEEAVRQVRGLKLF
jgi:hypothetical protein